MSKWKKYSLGDFAEINPRISLKQGNEYSFVEMKDLDATYKYVSPSTKKELKGGAKFQNGDTLFARITPCLENGKICQVKNLEDNVGFGSTEFLVFRGKENISNSDFVYYLSRSEFVKNNAIQMMTGTSGRQRVEKSALEELEITVPDLDTQVQISQILSSLDDKIELNLQMNQTLEAMAQTMFYEWFVNFNFPNFDGEMENDLPKGWKMRKVGDILQPKRGKNITKSEAIEGLFPVVAGGLEPSCYHNESNTKEPVITISSSGANAGYVRLYQTPVWSADSCFIDSSIFPYVHYCYIFLKSNQKNIYDSQEGSAQPHIYPRHIMDLNICIGNEVVVQLFEEIVIPFFEKIKYNSLQIQSLTLTRETLLPKLMRGEII